MEQTTVSRSLQLIQYPFNESAPVKVQLAEIPRAFQLPRVNWNVVRQWIEENVPEDDRHQTWTDVALQWLEELERGLGQEYRAIRNKSVLLFVPSSFEQAEAFFDLAVKSLHETTQLLGNLAVQKRQGPLVVLVFDDELDYYEYVSPLDPDLESLRSIGVCFKHDYVHIALRPHHRSEMERTLVHEIAHACLSDLNLPLWIEEGITQLAEEAEVATHARFSLDSEKANELRTYWRAEGLNKFWWGSGFLIPGVDQSLCYTLARILFRQLVSDCKKQLPTFLHKASAYDAGESAAKEVLGINLSQFASRFLGQGDWTPVPEDAIQYAKRALIRLQRDQYQDSIVDFSKSIELNDDRFESHCGLGIAYYLTDRTDAAVEQLNRAYELNAHDINVLNCLAWICATCPEIEFRNGERAVELATNACDLTQYSWWSSLFTLAAAYAESGNMADAQETANDAIGCAPDKEREFCEEMLQCFQAGAPWRDQTKEMFESVIGDVDILHK